MAQRCPAPALTAICGAGALGLTLRSGWGTKETQWREPPEGSSRMSGQRTGAMSTPNENLLDPLLSSPIMMLPGISESRLRPGTPIRLVHRLYHYSKPRSSHCFAAVL